MGHFQDWIKPRIWTSAMMCKLVITETLHFTKKNLLRSYIISPSSTEKGHGVCCKPAWGLQIVPGVSVCRTQQLCGWDMAYTRLGPPGTIHIRSRNGIFTSNTYGIDGDHQQELLQKHQDVITPEYPQRPYIIISGDLRCMRDVRTETPSW